MINIERLHLALQKAVPMLTKSLQNADKIFAKGKIPFVVMQTPNYCNAKPQLL